MRQVLDTCIHTLLSSKMGLMEDTANGDDFMTLTLSPGFLSRFRLDEVFVLGALSAIFMIKTHYAPFPISPALLLLAVASKPSHVYDRKWLKYVYPGVSAQIAKIPDDDDEPIPNGDLSLTHFVEGKLLGTKVSTLNQTQYNVG